MSAASDRDEVMMEASYDDLVAGALSAPFSGWDFSYLNGRVRDCDLPWSYEDLARSVIDDQSRVLDLNTGGGELLIEILQDRTPAHAVATESWEPNIAVAADRLTPRGVELRPSGEGDRLPAEDGEFTVVLNRHGGCTVDELKRVLVPGGIYLTQGVGCLNDIELNKVLAGPPAGYRDTATLRHHVNELTCSGFKIIDSGEAFPEYAFLDIGAVVYHLKAVSWQVPGFGVAEYDQALRGLDARIRAEGEFVVRHHRYFIKAVSV